MIKKLLNWLFPTKPESKKDQDDRIAEINSTFNELQEINNELKKKERELEALNRYLKT